MSKRCVQIGDVQYPYSPQSVDRISNRRIQAHVVSMKTDTTVWPNEELQIEVPVDLQLDDEVAVEGSVEGSVIEDTGYYVYYGGDGDDYYNYYL